MPKTIELSRLEKLVQNKIIRLPVRTPPQDAEMNWIRQGHTMGFDACKEMVLKLLKDLRTLEESEIQR